MTMRVAEDAGRSAAATRGWRGAAIFSRGFRPFFLAAGVWAFLGMAIWPFYFNGDVALPTAFSAIDWHAHEMIFGYGSAVVAGFLTTAIPNWTGRLPVAGRPLAGLAALWLAGRVAVALSALIGRPAAAAIDLSFLVVFAAVAAREVIAGRNTRNLKVVAVVAALSLANLAFHVEDALTTLAAYSQRGALALLVLLILLIGGRVTPSFTHNWLARAGVAARPVSQGRADTAAMILSGAALALWVAAPEGVVTGALTGLAGLANLWRLSRWRGWSARRDPLVLALHAGFLLAALGFLAVGAHALAPEAIPPATGAHVWSVGAVGTMTLAMMTRATLGHTGQALAASRATKTAFLAVALAMILRVAMALAPAHGAALMHAATTAWLVAFASFLAGYAPLLLRPMRPGR